MGLKSTPQLGFNLNAISGLLFWVEANNKTFQDVAMEQPAQTDGTQIRAWKDKSKLGNNATIGTAAPVLRKDSGQLRNNFSVEFVAASTQSLTATVAPAGSSLTVFIVLRTQTTVSSGYYIFSGEGDAVYARVGNPSASDLTIYAGTAATASGVIDATEKTFVISFTLNSGSCEIWVNGSNQGMFDVGAGSLGVFKIGSSAGDTDYADMRLPEFAIYDGVLSNSNITAINTHLVNKYGAS